MASSKKRAAISGSLLTGLGLGALAAWGLHIFEIGKPALVDHFDSSGDLIGQTSSYPPTALTTFLVLLFGAAFGLGLGLVACALIRDNSVQPRGGGTSPDPPGAGDQQ